MIAENQWQLPLVTKHVNQGLRRTPYARDMLIGEDEGAVGKGDVGARALQLCIFPKVLCDRRAEVRQISLHLAHDVRENRFPFLLRK